MVYSCLSGAALRLGLKRVVSDPSCDRRVRRTLVRAKLTIWWQVAQGGGRGGGGEEEEEGAATNRQLGKQGRGGREQECECK